MIALAGCAGSTHGAQNAATAAPDATANAVSAQATPFGVSPSTVIAAAPPVASAAAATAAPAAATLNPVALATARAAVAAARASAAAAAAAASANPATAPPEPGPAATAAPRILSVQTSPAVVHDGDTLLWNVRTTPDVVDVVAHVTVYAFRLAKQGTGAYVLTFTIPHGVPGFFHGTYTLDLVARSATGAETTTKVPVTFQ